MNAKERFDRYYLGDSGILRLILDVDKQLCTLELDRAALMKSSEELFDWEASYRPAKLTFEGVRKISFPDGYCLNYCIVDYSVIPSEQPGYFLFSLSMTGGWDNDTFMRTIEIIAKDFSLTGEVVASSQTE